MDANSLIIYQGWISILCFSSRMGKVPSSNRFAYLWVVFPAGSYLEAISIKDCQHLFPDVLGFFEGSGLDVVIPTPDVGVLVCLPVLVDCEKGKVISFWLIELCSFLISYTLLVLGSIKNSLHRQHRNNRNNFITTSQVNWSQKHFTQIRIQWELRHLPSKPSE